MKLLLLLTIIFTLYLYLIMPNLNKDRSKKMKSFEKKLIAHRGLYNNKNIPENSIKAFKKAIDNNYGIELDVQKTKDNQLVVFHDANLKRICGVDKLLTDCNYKELQKYKLLEMNQRIPLLKEVLALLDKKVPLIVEIKLEGDAIGTTDKTIELLNEYKLTYTMESFNPLVVYHLKKKYPHIIRGQLAYDSLNDKNAKHNILIKFLCTNLLLNFITKPDYVAYDIKDMDNLSFRIISKIYKGECVAWTIQSSNDLKKAKEYYQQFIFDSFDPSK